MNIPLFLTIFSGLGIVYLILGFLASRNIKTTVDYFLAGRKLGFFAVTFTLIATQLGGNMVIGASDWAYTYGLYGILYSMGMGLGFLLLSTGFAAKLHACNVATTAELFETKFNSKLLRKIASIISIMSLCGILVSTVLALKALLLGLGIHNEAIFIMFWVFIIAYTMIGGLKAVVVTDTFQVLLIIAILGGIFLYCLLFQPAPLIPLTDLIDKQSEFITTALSATKIIALFLMPALFSLMEQDLAQRFFAARSQRVALSSALGAALFIILFGFVPVYFGMQANLANIAIPAGGNSLVALLEVLTNSNIIFILAVCAITAAITSTADSLLCAISSNLAQDFDVSWLGFRNKLLISQGVTLLAGVSAFLASYVVTKQILDVTIASYELSVSCLLVPFLFALYKDNLNKNAAFGAALFGLIGFILFRIWPVPVAKEVATLSLSLLGYWIGNKIKN